MADSSILFINLDVSAFLRGLPDSQVTALLCACNDEILGEFGTMKDMKDKFLSIFLAFVRKTFSKERLSKFIADLLDILYENFDCDEDIYVGGEFDV